MSLDFKTKDIGKNIICEVGYVTPKDDFIYLLTKGESIDKGKVNVCCVKLVINKVIS